MNTKTEGLLLQVTEQVSLFYKKPIIARLDKEVELIIKVLDEVKAFTELSENSRNDHTTIAEYKAGMHELIHDAWQTPATELFSEKHAEFLNSLESIFKKVKKTERPFQKKDRFDFNESDPLIIKVLKGCKKATFQISKSPITLTHRLKGSSGKIQYWKHSIPLRNLAIWHFKVELILGLHNVTSVFFKGINGLYSKIKLWEEEESNRLSENSLDALSQLIKETKKEKSALVKQIEIEVNAVLLRQANAFEDDYEKTGTIELSNRRLTDSNIVKRLSENERKWSSNYLNWNNATYALFEEWRSDLDIHTLKQKTLAELKDLQVAQIKKLGDKIDPEIIEIRKFIEESKQSLKSTESLQKELKKVNYKAHKKLDKELVPRLNEKLSGQDITNLINKLEVGIIRNIERLSEEHVIVKTNNFLDPIKTSDLSKVSLFELITFESLADFQDQLQNIKKQLFSALETAAVGTTDIDNIITFSISSAVSSIEDEGKSDEEALIVAENGLERALNRLNESREKLEEAMHTNSALLSEAINAFCESIMALTVNENVGQLRLRINKAKATKHAEEVRNELAERVQTKRKLWIASIRGNYKKAEILLKHFGQKFILTAKKPELSKQVSDFLLESQQAIDKLPVIYRRLYSIEPVRDLELFEGRSQELNELLEAYKNWEYGRFASTIILGEKWGGLTSFLNYAILGSKFKHSVIRYSVEGNISSESQFIELIKSAFNNDSLENIDQLVDQLNNGKKMVVVLENIQKMFLRTVNGFTALQLLFELMTRTYKQVFWVASTTIYTWQYLSKTININEFFSYNIEMKSLTSDQIVNIIWKRNRISGFNIRFEPSKDHLEEKKFSKMNDSQQQMKLKDEFFSELNAFAKSNVSLALIFWLLSTKSVDENQITIGVFKKPNLNFLTAIAMNKAYALHALILHDGLSESQLSHVITITHQQSSLILLALYEDGIITKKNDVYMVNAIVYRDVIRLLKSRNLIH